MKRTLTSLAAAAATALIATSASAADFELLPPAPVLDWSGFYVGGHVGGAWGSAEYWNDCGGLGGSDDCPEEDGDPEIDVGPGLAVDDDLTGWFGGLQAGFDHQVGSKVVIGIVGDVSFADIDTTGARQAEAPAHVGTDIDWLATIRGRAGYLITPDVLSYVHAGVAFAGLEFHNEFRNDGGQQVGPFAGLDVDRTETGFAFGTGIEARITPTISAFAEYTGMFFGDDLHHYAFIDDEEEGGTDQHERFIGSDHLLHTLKVGVNVRFNLFN